MKITIMTGLFAIRIMYVEIRHEARLKKLLRLYFFGF
jgi:hypothetical protein